MIMCRSYGVGVEENDLRVAEARRASRHHVIPANLFGAWESVSNVSRRNFVVFLQTRQ